MRPPATSAVRSYALLCAVLLAGCTSWRPASLGTVARGPVPGSVQLTLRDGSTVIMKDAVLEGDTLLRGQDFYSDNRTVVVRDVTAVQVRRFDLGKTVTLVLGSATVGLPVLYGLTWLLYNLCVGPCT